MAPSSSADSSSDSGQERRMMKGSQNLPTAIVIGGGFAGLGAARALRNSNFKVLLLEARNRIGGRVHTDYSFGIPVDMGASWLHGVCHSNPLASLIRKLQLPLYRTSGDNSVLYDHDLESYALFDREGRQVPADLVARIGVVFEQMLEETRKMREELEDDISMDKALTLVLERRPELNLEGLEQQVLQWYLCRLEGWFASDADKLSVRHWDEEELLEGGHGLMVKGYFPVLQALSDGLDIRFNHRVQEIIQRSNGVRIVTECGKVFDADTTVITVPAGVLKANRIRFEPRLPEWKQMAMEDVGVGKENKIALLFDHVFWPKVDFLGLVAPTSYHCSYFLNLHKATGNPVLVYMPAGKLAHDIEKLSDEDTAKFASQQLKTILPGAPEPIKCLVTRWGVDPDSMGSYTFDAVGKSLDVYDRLRAPVGPLHFAGEATSREFPGTVHGAYSTGVMAAEECRKFVADRFTDLQLFQPVMGEELLPLRISRL